MSIRAFCASHGFSSAFAARRLDVACVRTGAHAEVHMGRSPPGIDYRLLEWNTYVRHRGKTRSGDVQLVTEIARELSMAAGAKYAGRGHTEKWRLPLQLSYQSSGRGATLIGYVSYSNI